MISKAMTIQSNGLNARFGRSDARPVRRAAGESSQDYYDARPHYPRRNPIAGFFAMLGTSILHGFGFMFGANAGNDLYDGIGDMFSGGDGE